MPPAGKGRRPFAIPVTFAARQKDCFMPDDGNSPPVTDELPDGQIVEAIGKIVLRSTHIERELLMIIKDLTGKSIADTLESNKKIRFGKLKKSVEKAAKEKLGTDFSVLERFLGNATNLVGKRNDYIHSTWGRLWNGTMVIQTHDEPFKVAPKIEHLNQIIKEMEDLLDEMRRTRIDGERAKYYHTQT
jgi:hypothetical protein